MTTLHIGLKPLTIEDVVALARGEARVAVDADGALRARIVKGAEILNRKLTEGQTVYGVSTGFGDSCVNKVDPEHALQMPHNLVRFHGCGTGRLLGETEAAAVVAVRVAALARGFSGVRLELLERLCALLNERLLPCIPEEGSVGASGDLTPLSYLAALVIGEREATFKGEPMSAAQALERAGLAPLTLAPKESLAMMNGTSVMTALGCLAFDRSKRLARLSAAVTALASEALLGEPAHFDERIFALKPHRGQALCARWLREDLEYDPKNHVFAQRVQDRYSLRCAPHVIGVLLDALPAIREALEIEANSCNDNPLVDPETGDVLHGGNFYGGHVAFAMDGLKTAVANLADLTDRQMAMLCTPSMNNGLPANLIARTTPDRVAHHGFKAMQISTSALTAEALKLTMPASVFSRSTECHNQDKVSMGTIAARDCLRVLELTETVTAIGLLAACQALDIRGGARHAKSRALHAAVRALVPVNDGDRRQDHDIQKLLAAYHSGGLPLGAFEEP